MCRRRIRVPDMWYGDYLASIGAARIGERRIKELIERYSLEAIREFSTSWLDYSERRMADEIAKLPATRLRASSAHDAMPGLPDGAPVNVELAIDPEAGRIEVDLRDNIDCVDLGINLSRCAAMAGSVIGIFNCLDSDLPHNAGSFRRIDVLIREGSAVGGLVLPALGVAGDDEHPQPPDQPSAGGVRPARRRLRAGARGGCTASSACVA